ARSSPMTRTTMRDGRRQIPAPRMSAAYWASEEPAGAGPAALSAYSGIARELLPTVPILLAHPQRSPEPRVDREAMKSNTAYSAQTRAGSIINPMEQPLPCGGDKSPRKAGAQGAKDGPIPA